MAKTMSLRLTTQAGFLTISRAVAQILNAAVAFVLVRHLSQVEYGTFRQVYLLAATLYLTQLGLTESLYYFIPAFPQRRGVFLRQTLAIVAIMQVVAGVLMVIFRQAFAAFFNNSLLASCIGLVALYSGLTLISRMWDVELVAEKRVPFAALVGVGFETLKVFLMFAALIIAPGIRPLLWALVAAAALKCVAFFLFLGREFRWFSGVGPMREAAPQFGYAMTLWIPGLLNFTIATQGPQYLVAHYFDSAQYAIYAVACFQVPFVAILTNSITEIFLVRATEFCRQGRVRDVYDLWITGCKKTLVLCVGIVAALVAFAHPIITVLFTSRYNASASLFAIMSFSLIFNGLFQDSILRAFSAMKTYALFYALRAIASVGLAFIGLKLWGMWGIALSTVVAIAVVNFSQLVPIAKLLRVSFRRVLPWPDIARMVLAAGSAVFVTVLFVHNIASPLVELLVGFALHGVFYAVLAMKLGLVSKSEVLALFQEFRGRLGRIPAVRPDMN
jgi:O-antigen/teichoic acid export membrane protein